MLRYELQSKLFAKKLSRRDLLNIESPTEVNKSAVVNVWRNHAFESLMPLMAPYGHFGNWYMDFRLGAYDDSLMFSDWQVCDVELVWLDTSRFQLDANFADWLDWLHSRLGFLRSISKAPIILATWTLDDAQDSKLEEMVDQFPAMYYANIKKYSEDDSVELLDMRIAKLAGSPVSNSAQLILARELACHWLPAVLFPPIKAVAIDLDHTLHCGVLGEDGIDAVQLTNGHQGFQEFIKSLELRGIFIALVSRNERSDVEALFAQRQDYPLRLENFSAVEVSWDDKASAIERIAKSLHIATEAILFVDDNLGELASVTMQLPDIHSIFAHPDADLTKRVVHYYPGLWRWKIESDDTKRIHDMKVNKDRTELAKNIVDTTEYFRSLQATLVYRNDPEEQITRLTDLCNKTNQFNLALRRFNQVEISECLIRDDACVASVQMYDRLSDSGVIAVIVAEREGHRLLVNELCISCRAMGRQLESTIILKALRDMPIFDGCQEVVFRVQLGPRNHPARDWLAGLLGLDKAPDLGLYSLPSQRIMEYVATEGVILQNQ